MAPDNHFLSMLPLEDRAALDAVLRPAEVAPGDILLEQGEPVREVHFPVDAQLVNLTLFRDGSGVETSIIGREGLSGLAPFMADERCAWRVMARTRGTVRVAPAAAVRTLMRERPALLTRLLSLTHFYQAQAAQTAACNAMHKLKPRVARWLLVAYDLTPSLQLPVTQEELGALLGAQRTSVNAATAELRKTGAIRYSRGAVRILDRRLLEREACECYAMFRAYSETTGLLPPP